MAPTILCRTLVLTTLFVFALCFVCLWWKVLTLAVRVLWKVPLMLLLVLSVMSLTRTAWGCLRCRLLLLQPWNRLRRFRLMALRFLLLAWAQFVTQLCMSLESAAPPYMMTNIGGTFMLVPLYLWKAPLQRLQSVLSVIPSLRGNPRGLSPVVFS